MDKARLPFNRSLHFRLLGFAGLTIAAALTLAWAVLGLLFERHAERQLQAELEHHGRALIAGLRLDLAGRPQLDRPLSDPRFERPASGLYWRLIAPGGELRSRSLWDGMVPLPRGDHIHAWVAGSGKGPFEPEILVVMRQVRPDTAGPAVQVVVAADRAPLANARADFGRETAIFLAALWLMLALAAWVQVRMGLRPLSGIRNELDAMSKAPDARLNVASHPLEIQPLTQAINQVAEQRAEDILRARQRARDLAHALKTPLTALRLQAETLPSDQARDMMYGLSLVSGAVESELARTGLQDKAGEAAATTIVTRILAVVSRTPNAAQITLDNHLPADLRIPMNEDAALEALGAVIENAIRHARSRVIISGGRDDDCCWLWVEDDGAGIPSDLRQMALTRGVRLDERSASHGLGLAIAQDFIHASGGELILEDAAIGGLSVRIWWPDGTPDASGDRQRALGPV